jgi:DNA repair photolyase
MNPVEHLAKLLAPWKVGDEALPGVRYEGAATELTGRFWFKSGASLIVIDVSAAEPGRRYASRSEHFVFGYRTEGGKSEVDSALAKRLCDVVADRSRENEAGVLAALEAALTPDDGAKIRSVEVGQLLERAGPPSVPFYTLSPYVGCLVGCRFCYAQSSIGALRRLLRLQPIPWGSYVDVRVNAPQVLAAELADPARELLPIKFCPIVSDPYQPIERAERLTRRCLEVIATARRSWPTLLLTRTSAILDDLELIASLPGAWVGVSLPTVDDGVRRHFEPRAASVSERIAVLARFREARVRTFVVTQPMLEGPLEAQADAIAAHASSASIDVLRGEEGAKAEFSDPRYAHTRATAWQAERAGALAAALQARGVEVWGGELPAELL